MCIVRILKKSIYCIVGVMEVLGSKGYWGVELIVLAYLALNLCLTSKIEQC